MVESDIIVLQLVVNDIVLFIERLSICDNHNVTHFDNTIVTIIIILSTYSLQEIYADIKI